MDLLDEARLAVLFARASRRRFDVIPATRAIELATRSGARALGLDTDIGTLEVGKSADLAAFPLDGLHALTVQDPESALLFATSGRGARLVTVEGRELGRNGQLLHDISDSIGSVHAAGEELRRFSSTPS
jgi:5-methylthioadenosine/S-adenosylhomocysteine deaminase